MALDPTRTAALAGACKVHRGGVTGFAVDPSHACLVVARPA